MYTGTPKELDEGEKMLENTMRKYLSKNKEGAKRYVIERNGNQLFLCLIDTPVGKKLKKVKDLEKEIDKLKKDKNEE